jgi:phage repressor protein C with HTH and peptisase S24 domain
MLQLNKNIKLIRELSGKKQGDFAKLIKTNISNLKTYENTTVRPKAIVLAAIADYAGITMEDLENKALTHKHIKFKPEEDHNLYVVREPDDYYKVPGAALVETSEDAKTYIEKRRERKNGSSQQAIPVYDLDVAASKSNLALVDDKNGTAPVDYLFVPEFSGCVAVNVYSDSMSPLLTPGSRMFIKKIEAWLDAIEYGQIYVIGLNDGRRFLKYIKRSRKEETHLLLHSHNPHYDDYEVPKSLVKSVWMVDGWMNKHTQSTFQLIK